MICAETEDSDHTESIQESNLDYTQEVVLRVTVKGTLEVPSHMSKEELEEWLATDIGKALLPRMDVQAWDEVAAIHVSKKATYIG